MFVGETYARYQDNYPSKPSVNGLIFEYLICEKLAISGIVPFYFQAQFALVPNANFDVVCYNPKRPVVLSMKVSLRERYKQADLEGIALRQVYRNAESYLITMNKVEAQGVARKIEAGDISGLHGYIIATDPEYSEFLKQISSREFSLASEIMPITGCPVSSV